jgi:predicted dithiol-disulfide oxidoreductase (DUF899 family)
MRPYRKRKDKPMSDNPPDARTMTDAEYRAAKAKLLAAGHADRRASDEAAELRRIKERQAARDELAGLPRQR